MIIELKKRSGLKNKARYPVLSEKYPIVRPPIKEPISTIAEI
jgi:hypothetical protein